MPGTLREILPASDAFKQGVLEMADSPAESIVNAGGPVSALTAITICCLVASAAIVILYFTRISKSFPLVYSSIFNKNLGLSIELNSESRLDRNLIALSFIFPLCILLDHYELFVPRIFEGIPHGWRTLAFLAMAAAYVLSRTFFGIIVRKPRKLTFDNWRAAKTSFYSFFCLMAPVTLALAMLMFLFGADKNTALLAILIANALIYLLELVRTGQILGEECSVFAVFLYLCGLEIAPAAAIVAISLWL